MSNLTPEEIKLIEHKLSLVNSAIHTMQEDCMKTIKNKYSENTGNTEKFKNILTAVGNTESLLDCLNDVLKSNNDKDLSKASARLLNQINLVMRMYIDSENKK